MDISTAYAVYHKLDNFPHYQVAKKYESQSEPKKRTKNFHSDRKTYVSEIQKHSKQSPGVGRYTVNPQFQNSSMVQRKKGLKNSKPKMNFIDEVIKQKKSVPQVGKYDLVKDKTQEIRKKYKIKGDSEKKKAHEFRPTLPDTSNVDTAKIGPGSYNTTKPLGYKSQTGAFNPLEHKSPSLPKLPSAQDYEPIPVSFSTFSRMSEEYKKEKLKNPTYGIKLKEVKKSSSPGPKYNLISDWATHQKGKKKRQHNNLFRSVSTLNTRRVYHDRSN